MSYDRLSRRTFLKAAGLASLALASLPVNTKPLASFLNPPANPGLRFPPQLLIDFTGFGSGWGPNFARILGHYQPEEVIRFRNFAIAYARHGRHWLGPRALNELLTIATNQEEETTVRANAIGALARAVREWRDVPQALGDASPVEESTDDTIRLAWLLLDEEEETEHWERKPALMETQWVEPDRRMTAPLPGNLLYAHLLKDA